MTTCGIISFRFSNHDGVSKVSNFWQSVLSELGFDVITIAGEGDADRLIPELAIGSPKVPIRTELYKALQDCNLVLVENIGTIPLNLPASLMLLDLLAGRRAIFHHHDLPWQRPQHGHIRSLPADDAMWEHVVINDFTKFQMEALGLAVTRIYNPVDINQMQGDRNKTRSLLGVADDQLLVIHPTRAIRIKNIPSAVAFTEKLGGIYWLVGPAEEGYEATLKKIISNASCKIITKSNSHLNKPTNDMYAAADLLIFPSMWESFGIPPIEAAVYKIPTAVGDYPVAEEQRKLGLRWFYPWETKTISEFLINKNDEILEHNKKIVAQNFSFDIIAKQIINLIKKRKWLP